METESLNNNYLNVGKNWIVSGLSCNIKKRHYNEAPENS